MGGALREPVPFLTLTPSPHRGTEDRHHRTRAGGSVAQESFFPPGENCLEKDQFNQAAEPWRERRGSGGERREAYFWETLEGRLAVTEALKKTDGARGH